MSVGISARTSEYRSACAAHRHQVGGAQQHFEKLQIHQILSTIVDLGFFRHGCHRGELLGNLPEKGAAGYGDICGNAYDAERVRGESVELVGIHDFR